MTAMTGTVAVPVRMCKDAEGVWHRVQAQVGGTGPNTFNGNLELSGTFSGSQARQNHSNAAASLDFNRMLRDALNTAKTTKSINGNVTVDLYLNGNTASGTFRFSGQDFNDTARLKGTAANGRCQLADDSGKVVFTGTCTGAGLAGSIRSDYGYSWHTEITLNTRTTSKADYGQVKLAQEAERQRAAEKRAEELRSHQQFIENETLLAEAGHADAMLELAISYRDGDWVEADQQKSTYWMGRAAAMQIPAAVHDFADNLWKGRGIAPDPARAAGLFQKCAQMRDKVAPWCARNLAVMYYKGEGVQQNKPLSIRWFRTCAKLGDDSCNELADQISQD